ncbi:MFS transporter [Rhodococcus sp. 14-2483-1-2]|uniref:MFS transporter n=1 Tax=Rhodococcus sp. 14-2483-1-2 TaxID=2023147 RepID=UPI0014832181|nr:MFS transporter [Rhodococcus sp. 14-2483-1-2]
MPSESVARIADSAIDRPLTSAELAVSAVVAGIAIANGYAIAPALGEVAADLETSLTVVGFVTSGSLVGYLIGVLMLVPLVDRMRPAVVIAVQLLALSAALTCAAWARSAAVLIAVFVLIGALTSVSGQSSAVVGRLADPVKRGTALGVVAAGISAGIVSSRLVGGILASAWGWRAMLAIFAGCCLVAASAALAILPRDVPSGAGRRQSVVRTAPALLMRHRSLRLAAASGALWFFAFNLIWVGLSLALSAEPYSLNARTIGLYSLAGLLGLAATWPAGKLTDRWGSRRVMLASLSVAAIAALLLTVALGNPVWTAVALAVFDAGCFGAQVANQAAVVAVDDRRAGTLLGVYMLIYYSVGALGTVVASMLATFGGWPATTMAAASAMAVATALTYLSPRIRPVSARP